MAGARERWSAFLEKIEARHDELLQGAAQALPGLVPDAGFDLLPFSNALTAVRTQCIGLWQKIDRTWSDSAEAALEADGADRNTERARGSVAAARMERALRKAEVEIAAAAAEIVVERARATLTKEFKCTRCGAALKPKQSFFRSHYVPCEFCQSMNTFEPGMIARQVEHFAVHALAERAALEANLRFFDAERAYRDRSAGAPTKEKLVELYSAQVDTYLNERVKLLPDLAKDLAADRRAKIDAFVYSIA